MTMSKEKREENCNEALKIMLKELGGRAIHEAFFRPSDTEFKGVYPTTWEHLADDKLIEKMATQTSHRMTVKGWLTALGSSGELRKKELQEKFGLVMKGIKKFVKGRQESKIVSFKELVTACGTAEGFVFNIIECDFVGNHYEKKGASWNEKGKLVKIPLDFNIELADLKRIIDGGFWKREYEGLEDELVASQEKLQQFQCRYCGAELVEAAPIESGSHTGSHEAFACGYSCIDGSLESPCPSDPRYPKFEDYEIITQEQKGGGWTSLALGKTPMAKRVFLVAQNGKTKEQAEKRVKRMYEYYSKPLRQRGPYPNLLEDDV